MTAAGAHCCIKGMHKLLILMMFLSGYFGLSLIFFTVFSFFSQSIFVSFAILCPVLQLFQRHLISSVLCLLSGDISQISTSPFACPFTPLFSSSNLSAPFGKGACGPSEKRLQLKPVIDKSLLASDKEPLSFNHYTNGIQNPAGVFLQQLSGLLEKK